MVIAERLSEEVDRMGLRWGAEGLREKAVAVVTGLSDRAEDEPLVALSLLQASLADPTSAGFLGLPSTKLVRDAIRGGSEILGEGELPRWVMVIAEIALRQMGGKHGLLLKLAPTSTGARHWEWKAPGFEVGTDRHWKEVTKVINAVVDANTKVALTTLHGKVGALSGATQAFATTWSPPTHLLWWAQAEWSEPYHRPWSHLLDEGRGAILAGEFARVAPAADAAVNFFLKTLRDQGVTLGEARPLSEWTTRARDARAWGLKQGHDWLPAPARGLSEQLAAEPTGLPIYASLLGNGPADEPDLPAGVFHRRLAEELLIVRHVFGA